MATIKQFEDIEAWKMARELCSKIGALIDAGTFKNSFKLISQIEASSGSIMDNIAEGFERGTRGEFIQFLGYAKGSCGELRSQLYRSLDRNFINQSDFETLHTQSSHVSGKIQNLISYLNKTNVEGIRKKR